MIYLYFIAFFVIPSAIIGILYVAGEPTPCGMCDTTGRGITDAGEVIPCIFCSGKGTRR